MSRTGSARSRRRLRGTTAFVALAVGGMLAVSACSSSGGTPSVTGGNAVASTTGANASCPTATKKLNLAFVYSTTSQNPFQEMAYGAQAAADQDGNVDLKLSAPPSVDTNTEVQMLTSAAQTSKDGIAWESVAPDSFLRELQNIKQAGIPLVAVDNMTPAGVQPDLLVSNSNTDLGKQLGEAFVAQKPKPDGEAVMILDIPSLELLKQRIQGVMDVIKAKLPNMKIAGPFDGKSNGGQASNQAAIQGMVNSHPKAVAFIGVGGPDGTSLPAIKQKTGATWLAGSADIPDQALQGVKSGALFALSSPEHWLKGYFAVYNLIQAKRTCKAMPTGWWDSGNLLINSSNIDAILARQKDQASRTAWFMKNAVPQQIKNPPLKSFSDLN